MTEDKQRFWFPAKSYGWGWGLPSRWQGWLVLVVYLAAVAGILYLVPETRFRVPYLVIATIWLLVIVVFKGEKPLRWRWGKD